MRNVQTQWLTESLFCFVSNYWDKNHAKFKSVLFPSFSFEMAWNSKWLLKIRPFIEKNFRWMSKIHSLERIFIKKWGKNHCFPVLLPCQKSFQSIPLNALVKKHSKKVAKVQRICWKTHLLLVYFFSRNHSSLHFAWLLNIFSICCVGQTARRSNFY